MAIDAVGAASRSAAAGADARFARGAIIEAEVAAILDDGTVRLSTPFGMADVTTDVAMQPGQSLRLAVQSVAGGLTFALLTEGGDASAAVTPQQDPATGPASAPAVLRAVAEAMQRGSASSAGTTALFANLPALLRGEAGGMPSVAAAPASAVLSHALSADRPVTAQAVRSAIQGSGLFREAHLAQGDGQAAQPGADLKSALVALRSVLAGLSAAFDAAAEAQGGTAGETASPAPTPGPPTGQAAAVPAASAPAPAAAPEASAEPFPTSAVPPQPGQAGDAAGDAPSAAAAASPRAAVAEAPPPVPLAVGDTPAPGAARQSAGAPASPGLLALPPAIAAAVANLPEPQRSAVLRLLERSLQPDGATGGEEIRAVLEKAGLVGDTALASHPDDAASARQATLRYGGDPQPKASHAPATPPRSDSPPRAEPSSVPTIGAESGAAATTKVLLGETDAALDRVLLNQYASLPREHGSVSAAPGPHGHAWMLDMPILMGREATTAQVRIARDDGSASGNAGRTGPRWSVDLALDSSALGPVHARVRLADHGVSVTLWAERPDTAERFREGSTVLRKALDEASLMVDDVEFRAGSPQRAPAAKGYFVDTRS